MRFAADENFNGHILNQLREAISDFDVVRIQDTPMYQATDPKVLEWVAQEQRILLTHDVHTLVGDAYKRVEAGLTMPGVILVPSTLLIGKAIEDLVLLIEAGVPSDFENLVVFIPLI